MYNDNGFEFFEDVDNLYDDSEYEEIHYGTADIHSLKGYVHLIRLDCVNSTNDYLKDKALCGAHEGAVVISERQWDGKGTRERSFVSPQGGLYMSILLRPNFDKKFAALITPMAAVAVRKAISEVLHKECGIKWVNDLFYEDKKVCGILAESTFQKESFFVVLGIGVNVFTPKEGFGKFEEVAAALQPSEDFDRKILEYLAVRIHHKVMELYRRLPDAKFMAEYKQHSILLKKRIFLNGLSDTPYDVVDIDGEGKLILERNGLQTALVSGDVSLCRW